MFDYPPFFMIIYATTDNKHHVNCAIFYANSPYYIKKIASNEYDMEEFNSCNFNNHTISWAYTYEWTASFDKDQMNVNGITYYYSVWM